MLKKGYFIPLGILTPCYRGNAHIPETAIKKKKNVCYLSMTDHPWENISPKTFFEEKCIIMLAVAST